MSSLALPLLDTSLHTDTDERVFNPSLVLLLLHIPLGVIIKLAPLLGKLHGVVLLCVGLIWVGQKKVERVAYLCAYLVSCEVLWRMANASIFWEFTKYALVLIMGGYVFLWGMRGVALAPIVAAALLLPSMLLTASQMGLMEARATIAVTVTAYFSLVAASSFFHPLQINREELKATLFALIMPAVSVASIALYGTLTSEKIKFVNDSNFELSGGFGPNQVSSILGLALFSSLLYFFLDSKGKFWRVLMLILSLWFFFQTMMTYSRGGLYCSVGAICCLAVWLKDKQIRLKMVLIGVPVVLFGLYFVFPRLNNFTEGTLSRRFEDTQTTHRGELIEEELDVWRENIIFGVGIGQARYFRAKTTGASHSEFSRVLAEHGMFGVLTVLVLCAAIIQRIIRGTTLEEKSLLLSFSVWTILFTFTAALRLVAPAFILGLVFARFDLFAAEERTAGA